MAFLRQHSCCNFGHRRSELILSGAETDVGQAAAVNTLVQTGQRGQAACAGSACDGVGNTLSSNGAAIRKRVPSIN
ncbi:MAG: hypothetical protein IPP36_06095 [Nitrosomonadales bacterium]|nr:hypothetical protein [Nitrosomonadales bacterium]